MVALTPARISEAVMGFHREMVLDPNHRYLSWEHCYKFFATDPQDYDLASLHLAFYLASWGMYRGSSFLLQKDYKVHLPIVQELLKPEYRPIKAISLDALNSADSGELISLIMKLVVWVKNCYATHIGHERRHINVTDTLATKILMGTLGCIPAYDRYFIEGLKAEGLSFSYLNRKNFAEMVGYCQKRRDDFLAVQEQISHDGLNYPIMKVIDMYFWQIGKNSERAMG